VEVAALPGGLEEKLEYARKHGLAVTAADLVAKLVGATKALYKTAGEIGVAIYRAREAAAAARGAASTAKQLAGVAHRFERMVEAAERIERVGNALTILADSVRLVAALAEGDYEAAGAAGLDLATDAAPLIFGKDLAGPLAVAVVTIKAEIEPSGSPRNSSAGARTRTCARRRGRSSPSATRFSRTRRSTWPPTANCCWTPSAARCTTSPNAKRPTRPGA
jgi:hypothetical protein